MKSTPPYKALHRGSWASIVSDDVGSAPPTDVLLQSTLATQAKLLMRVGSFLERAEAALDKLSLVSAVLQSTPTSRPSSQVDVVGGSIENRGEELYGCFSPRVGDNLSSMSAAESKAIAVVVAPVLQIMPELQQLCVRPVSPQPMEHVEVVSLVTPVEGQDSPRSCEQLEASGSIVSVVSVTDNVEAVKMLASDPLEPSQMVAIVEREGSDVTVTHSHETVGQVSVHDKVNDILFQIEIHSLLKHLEAASPGSDKAIVEEVLRSKRMKSGATRKASAAA
ncbi:hypothetical protein VPH35_063955 [Triticum aestivum]